MLATDPPPPGIMVHPVPLLSAYVRPLLVQVAPVIDETVPTAHEGGSPAETWQAQVHAPACAVAPNTRSLCP